MSRVVKESLGVFYDKMWPGKVWIQYQDKFLNRVY